MRSSVDVPLLYQAPDGRQEQASLHSSSTTTASPSTTPTLIGYGADGSVAEITPAPAR